MGDPAKIEGGTAVKGTVPVVEATRDEAVLPEPVQEALGQLVGAAKEGLLALSVEVGLGSVRRLLGALTEARGAASIRAVTTAPLPLQASAEHDRFA
jgi:hypothetical protein